MIKHAKKPFVIVTVYMCSARDDCLTKKEQIERSDDQDGHNELRKLIYFLCEDL